MFTVFYVYTFIYTYDVCVCTFTGAVYHFMWI